MPAVLQLTAKGSEKEAGAARHDADQGHEFARLPKKDLLAFQRKKDQVIFSS
jgi:hypothetical protein